MNGFVSMHVAQLLGLFLSLYLLSCRYYTSATYERPIHFALLTLVLTAFSIAISTRLSVPDSHRGWRILPSSDVPLRTLNNESLLEEGAASGAPNAPFFYSNLKLIYQRIVPFCYLVFCVSLRTALFWLVLRTSQCGRPGIEAFLPFTIVLCDILGVSSSRLLEKGVVDRNGRLHRQYVAYGLIALLWGFTSMKALSELRTATGTICPADRHLNYIILCAQVAVCAFDASLLVSISDLIHLSTERHDDDLPNFISAALLASALCIFTASFTTLFHDSRLLWAFSISLVELKDLAIDSLAAAIFLSTSFFLLRFLHPTTIGLTASSLGLFGFYEFQSISTLVLPPQSVHAYTYAVFLAVAVIGILLCLTLHQSHSSHQATSTVVHRWLALAFLTAFIAGTVFHIFWSDSPTVIPMHEAVHNLVAAGGRKSKDWTSQALKSHTLEQAVTEYQRRYSVPPPSNFDKWYEFAVEQNSPVIDDFDQIHMDLLPFWGLEAEELRYRTSFLLSNSNLEMAQLKIRNGSIETSPYVPNSHRWMMDSMKRMIDPFSKWLPDMDLAINLSDECRMTIPSDDMNALKSKALDARARMTERSETEPRTATRNNGGETSRWIQDFIEPVSSDHLPAGFIDNTRSQLFYDFVAPTCPPHSPARNKRWWDWSTRSVDSVGLHSVATEDGLLVSNATLAQDLCHQPDVAYLDGFIMSPSGAMVGTKSLYPIFSQGRVGGFSDILIPSPWNFDRKSSYDEDSDMAWDDKINGLFWRGSSSDGYAADGTWTGFLRARFVHEAYEKSVNTAGMAELPIINVSFAGDVSRCHQADCKSELWSFRKWAEGVEATRENQRRSEVLHASRAEETPQNTLPTLPFEENFRFKYLFDMDGAGFSGRFLPFLKSQSLVYRAGLFHTWFDERLTAWHHYIPVDIRLGSGFWALLDYLSTSPTGNDKKEGDAIAKNIADQGRQWAQRTLRPEDMQIYMFRLLLEWGRLVNND